MTTQRGLHIEFCDTELFSWTDAGQGNTLYDHDITVGASGAVDIAKNPLSERASLHFTWGATSGTGRAEITQNFRETFDDLPSDDASVGTCDDIVVSFDMVWTTADGNTWSGLNAILELFWLKTSGATALFTIGVVGNNNNELGYRMGTASSPYLTTGTALPQDTLNRITFRYSVSSGASDGILQIWLNDTQALDDNIQQVAPNQRDDIEEWLEANLPAGSKCIFLCGDRHCATVNARFVAGQGGRAANFTKGFLEVLGGQASKGALTGYDTDYEPGSGDAKSDNVYYSAIGVSAFGSNPDWKRWGGTILTIGGNGSATVEVLDGDGTSLFSQSFGSRTLLLRETFLAREGLLLREQLLKE